MTDTPTTPSPERQPADAGVEAILDCPFCGDAAHLDYDTDTEMFGVEAEHAKGCILKNWDFRNYADEHAAINAWNRRAPAPQAQPDARAVEALMAAQSFIADGGLAESEPGASIYRQITQALSTSAADDGWRPIESAPKDGKVIDVWRDDGGRDTVSWGFPPHCCGEMGRYCDDDWHSIRAPGWVCNTFGEFVGRSHNPFTHWRPLPAPPPALHPAAPTDEEERS